MLFDILLILCTLTISVLAGILSGMFGIGGGIFYVPALNFILKHYFISIPNAMIVANNTSLACILILNSITFLKRYKELDLYYWQIIVRILLLGVGAFLGGVAIRRISHESMSIIFGCSIIIMGLYYYFLPEKYDSKNREIIKGLFPIIFIPISFLTSLLGIGGAIFLFPLQIKIGYSRAKSAAASTFSTIIVATTNLVWLWIEPHPDILNKYFIGDIFWPMILLTTVISPFFIQTGIGLNKKFSKRSLNRILGLLLGIIAVLHLSV